LVWFTRLDMDDPDVVSLTPISTHVSDYSVPVVDPYDTREVTLYSDLLKRPNHRLWRDRGIDITIYNTPLISSSKMFRTRYRWPE